MKRLVLAAAIAACGGSQGKELPGTTPHPTRATTAGDRILPLLPDGAQIVVELDVARLRKNQIIGGIVGKAIDANVVPGEAPLAGADAVVLAAYGVGTAQAATVTIVATRKEVANGRRLAADLVAIGPPDWLDQLAARAAIAGYHPDAEAPDGTLAAPAALLQLRDHAMPKGATGAAIRVTARLPFDARISLARQLGTDGAPGQLSVWGDVADDFAVVVDADADDPGDKAAGKRLGNTIRRALASLGDDPTVRALGILDSLRDAHIKVGGTWVRTIIAIGPEHLKRVVARADKLLGPP